MAIGFIWLRGRGFERYRVPHVVVALFEPSIINMHEIAVIVRHTSFRVPSDKSPLLAPAQPMGASIPKRGANSSCRCVRRHGSAPADLVANVSAFFRTKASQ